MKRTTKGATEFRLGCELAAEPRPIPQGCLCGCGGLPKNGKWLPGHDSRALAKRVRQLGGIECTIELLDILIHNYNLGVENDIDTV